VKKLIGLALELPPLRLELIVETQPLVNRALFALLASVVVGSALGESTDPTRIRITTWNLEWFPSGSAKEAERQNQRIKKAADVLRPNQAAGDACLWDDQLTALLRDSTAQR
jgi:hypothetical protein